MQLNVNPNEATLTPRVCNIQLHVQPLDHIRAPTPAEGDIRTDHARRTSPGAASAAASIQTRHISLVRAPSPPQPVPSQTLTRASATSATPIKESDT
eukprot:7845346-Pyramimonas_sp.AAC.1